MSGLVSRPGDGEEAGDEGRSSWLGLRAEGVPTIRMRERAAAAEGLPRVCRRGAQMQIRRAVEKPKFGQASGLVGFHPRCTLLHVGGGISQAVQKPRFGGCAGLWECVGNILEVVAGTGRASIVCLAAPDRCARDPVFDRRPVSPVSSTCSLTVRERHYSYECKAGPQERPYVPRPSRTQQLLDPKLRPQLTNDTPDAFQKKTGVADAELAKKAAQREKEQKALQDSDSGSESGNGGVAKADHRRGHRNSRRRRSRSYDSVSSAPARSASPPPRRVSISPERERERSRSPRRRSGSPRSERSYSRSDVSRSPSPRPEQRDDRRREYRSRSASRGSSRSPRRDRSLSRGKERASLSPPRAPEPRSRQGGGHYSSDEEPRNHRSRGGGYPDDDEQLTRPRQTRRRDSRSPGRGTPVDTRGGRDREPVGRQYRDRRDPRDERDDWRGSPPRWAPPPRSPPRERSLSPFSKRRALTQAGNSRG
ncbi:hypothetical protein MAPG_09698 [Magnaporthiopsis poae ATCC 64411]|uniref:Uncharacterized protein n=1 Tax=Magnaporthiopsis poae (strain ATCC 64411 / 73-15) TaxID=644358 RepID=A0A0C4EAM3_MAGP6|nr:hypothetical protein MAPG_09698 [Magnaporthiopsis poae ATCC 64411]